MTDEEREYLNIINEVESEENNEEGLLDTLKHMGKHMLVSTAAAVPGAYLSGGGKALGPSLVAGPLAGLVTSVASNNDDKSIVAPAGTGFGVGLAIGAKEEMDERARKARNQNMSDSEISDFFSSYNKEGLESFSSKLQNFMDVYDPLEYEILDDPEIQEASRAYWGGTAGAITGLGMTAGPGVVAGSVIGAVTTKPRKPVSNKRSEILDFLDEINGRKIQKSARRVKGLAGAMLRPGIWAFDKGVGAVKGGLTGGLITGSAGASMGAYIGGTSAIEDARRKKINKLIKKAQMNEYLTEDEKEFIRNAFSDDFNDNLKNIHFSKNNNFGALGTGLKVAGAGAAGAGGVAVFDKVKNWWNGESEPQEQESFPNIFTGDPSKENEGRFGLGAAGAGVVGGLIGNHNGSAMQGAITGTVTGGLLHYLAERGELGVDMTPGTAAALSVGGGALAAYLASKIFENKQNEIEEKKFNRSQFPEVKKRGRGRPRKNPQTIDVDKLFKMDSI